MLLRYICTGVFHVFVLCLMSMSIGISQATPLSQAVRTMKNIGVAPWLFNLYIDPKEQYPVGHRRNAWLATMGAEAKEHAATFKKYPPKEVGLKTGM
jgi:hypothetical protein